MNKNRQNGGFFRHFAQKPAIFARAGRFLVIFTNFSDFFCKTLCILMIDKFPKVWYNNNTVKGRQDNCSICERLERKNFSKSFEKPLDKLLKV